MRWILCSLLIFAMSSTAEAARRRRAQRGVQPPIRYVVPQATPKPASAQAPKSTPPTEKLAQAEAAPVPPEPVMSKAADNAAILAIVRRAVAAEGVKTEVQQIREWHSRSKWPYKLLATKPVESPELFDQLKQILASEDTYIVSGFPSCLEPGMAVAYRFGETRVDVVLCLHCEQALVYVDRNEDYLQTNITSKASQELFKIYRDQFGEPKPDDPEGAASVKLSKDDM